VSAATDRGPAVPAATGALDDGRHYLRQLIVGLLGWVAAAGVVVYLVITARTGSLRIAFFFITLAVVVALIGALAGAELLRPPVLRNRRAQRPRPSMNAGLDALGRPLPVITDQVRYAAEVIVESTAEGRTFRAAP
jgi:hypothetical protein